MSGTSSMTREQTATKPLHLRISWGVTLLAIPLLSYFGRNWLGFVLQYASRTEVAIAFAVTTLGLVGGACWWLFHRRVPRGLIHLGIAAVGAGLVFLLVPAGERWLHIPLFGLFGFLSVCLLGLLRGLAVALAISGLDEIWQHFLPDRHGDLVDVAINTGSASLGMLVACGIGDGQAKSDQRGGGFQDSLGRR